VEEQVVVRSRKRPGWQDQVRVPGRLVPVDIDRQHDVELAMTIGQWVSQAVYAVAELGIPDLLKDGARSAAEIAASVNTNEDAGLNAPIRAIVKYGSKRSTKTAFSASIDTAWFLLNIV
jgi:hypothetical protein